MDSIMEIFNNENVDIGSLPQIEKVNYEPVLGQYLLKINIQTVIFLLFLATGTAVLWYFIGAVFAVPAIIFLLLFFTFRFWNNWKFYQSVGYALREKDILYRRGFIVSRTTVVPFNRIQHASVSRDFLDKFLNIATLQVFTAGGSGSDISISGLDPDLALKLKESLATRISTDEA